MGGGALLFPAFSRSGRVPIFGLVVLDELDVGALAGQLGVFVDGVNVDPGVAVDLAALGQFQAFGGTPGAREGHRGFFEQLRLAFPGFLDGGLVGPTVDVAAGGALVDPVNHADGGDPVLGAELFAVGRSKEGRKSRA